MILKQDIERKMEDGRRKMEESRSFYFTALKGRNILARGSALGLNENAIKIAPGFTANYCDIVEWGKTNSSRIKNRSLFSETEKERFSETELRKENNRYSINYNHCKSLRKFSARQLKDGMTANTEIIETRTEKNRSLFSETEKERFSETELRK